MNILNLEYSNKSGVFYFQSTRRRFRVRGILIVIPIDFQIMGVISRFGLDWKKENRKRKAAFFILCFEKKMRKIKKIALGSDFTQM